MSFEAERAKIETHFQTQWALTPFATTTIIFENSATKQPSTDFVMHQVLGGDGFQKEIVGNGPTLLRYSGLVQVDILVKSGTGTANARKMADAVSDIYRRQTLVDGAGGKMVFRIPSVRTLGVVSERYRVIVSCPYYRDIIE